MSLIMSLFKNLLHLEQKKKKKNRIDKTTPMWLPFRIVETKIFLKTFVILW